MSERKRKKKRDTAYRKEANAVFQKGAGNAFTGGGTAYQPGDSSIGKLGRGSGSKRQTEKSIQAQQEAFGQKFQRSKESQPGKDSTFTENKSMDSGRSDAEQRKTNHASKVHTKKQMYQKTSGHKAQKSNAKSGQEEKLDFVKESSGFTKQGNFSPLEEREKKQPDAEDYHQRDTYRQLQKKGKYHKKRVKREHQNKSVAKEKQEYKTFTEESFTEKTGNLFPGKGDSEFTDSKKLKKKQRQAERAARKVQKARAKLPKTRESSLQRVFDEKTGKGKYVVVPLDKEKPFKQEGIPKTTMRRMQNGGRNFVHGKIAEREKENSAVEGAHKSEQKVESAYSFVKRQIKGKEQKQRAKVTKLEKKQFKKKVNFQYQKFLEENPQLQEKTLKKQIQKRLQKQRIKREYIKARQVGQAAKNTKETVIKSANFTTTIAKKFQEKAAKHVSLLVTIGAFALLFIMIMATISSCGGMFSEGMSTTLEGSYMSVPAEIDAADLAFSELEMELQKEIDSIERDYPDYDEYRYNLAPIGHDPFVLISYLSAVHTEFIAADVQGEIESLFDEMYELTLKPITETRTRTVTKTGIHTVMDPVTGEEMEEEYEYEEEEEYTVTILEVTLTAKDMNIVVVGHMESEQKEIYTLYNETHGLTQQFYTPLNLYWHDYVSSYYGYRINPVTGAEQFHRGVDIAVPTRISVLAAMDGIVTDAAFDSYYGNYIVIEDSNGYCTKYAHMNTLSVRVGQVVKHGDTIGKMEGSTGNYLHIECLYNGEYYNPLFYFEVGEETLYGEINTQGI